MLLAAPVVLAHGDIIFEGQSGNYFSRILLFVDGMVAGTELPFNVTLYVRSLDTMLGADGDTADFTRMDVVVREKDGGEVFSNSFNKEVERVGTNWEMFTYTFPKGGEYVLAVTFFDETKRLAEIPFGISVYDNPYGSAPINPALPQDDTAQIGRPMGRIALSIVIILGIIIGLIYFLRKK